MGRSARTSIIALCLLASVAVRALAIAQSDTTMVADTTAIAPDTTFATPEADSGTVVGAQTPIAHATIRYLWASVAFEIRD